MKEYLNSIRNLLDKMEAEAPSESDTAFLRDFSALELSWNYPRYRRLPYAATSTI